MMQIIHHSKKSWELSKNVRFIKFNHIQARIFFTVSGTIKANPMKLVLPEYKKKFSEYNLWRHNVVIIKNNEKIRTSTKPDTLYIIRNIMMRAFGKWNFIEIESLNQKLWLFTL